MAVGGTVLIGLESKLRSGFWGGEDTRGYLVFFFKVLKAGFADRKL